MAHETPDDGLIRRYLLGRLAEGEREQLEEKMMADNEFFNAVLLAEDEMVEEYVQRELPESDRASFEASFLSTPEGRQQVAYAKALSRYVSPTPVWWRRPNLVPYVRWAAAAIAVLVVAVGVWLIIPSRSEVSKGMASLAYAYREQRPLEARISGLGYAPAALTRGDEERVDRVARNRAERILLDEVLEHPSAAAHHALGRLYLAERKFDAAIAQFDEALRADPNDALLYSDYGVALLEKGRAEGYAGERLAVLEKALQRFDRAIELDGSLLEALFNRALCREEMKLFQQAREDWRSYLEKDPASRWTDESRKHLTAIEQPR